jgi:hypothetical protein
MGGRFLGLFLARQNRLQRIAGLGDLREIDFGAELVPAAAAAAMAVDRATGLAEILADLLGLVFFHGAGVGLFLRDADLDKHVENLFAFHFQLASQIVNSNLHPPLLSFMPCRLHLPGTVRLRRSAVLLVTGESSPAEDVRTAFAWACAKAPQKLASICDPADRKRKRKRRAHRHAAAGYLFAGSASASPG